MVDMHDTMEISFRFALELFRWMVINRGNPEQNMSLSQE